MITIDAQCLALPSQTSALETRDQKLHVHIEQLGRGPTRELKEMGSLCIHWVCKTPTFVRAVSRMRGRAVTDKKIVVRTPIALHPFTKQRLSKACGHASHHDDPSAATPAKTLRGL
jgi:hypothetical protein